MQVCARCALFYAMSVSTKTFLVDTIFYHAEGNPTSAERLNTCANKGGSRVKSRGNFGSRSQLALVHRRIRNYRVPPRTLN